MCSCDFFQADLNRLRTTALEDFYENRKDHMLMATKTHIDFHAVEPKHGEIHRRLQNWANWCNGSSASATSPMFRLYIAPARARGAEASWSGVSVDGADASRIARFVAQLPEPHRRALVWCYLKPIGPQRAARQQGTTLAGLAQLLRDGRQMLINRQA